MLGWRVSSMAIVGFLLGAPRADPEPPAWVADLVQQLPSDVPGGKWRLAEAPADYAPENLFEYLDGGAERYVSYGFKHLVHARYACEEHGDDGVTLDVFDMGSELGAFGIYRSALPPDAAPRVWGSEGYRSRAVAAGWKGRFFVHGEAEETHPALIEVLERFVSHVLDEVDGETSLPAILELLPPEGLIPRSERYEREDLLGHAFLPGGLLATYNIEGHRAQLFCSDLGNEDRAAAAIARLRAHHVEWGATVHGESALGPNSFRFSGDALGSGTVTTAGRFVVGVHGEISRSTQSRLLRRLVEKLRSSTTSH